MGDDSSSNLGEQCIANIPTMVQGAENKDCTTKQKRPVEAPSASRSSWQASGERDTPTWRPSGPQGTASFWERAEAPLPHPKRWCNFIHPKQLSPFLNAWSCRSSEEILSGYEDIVSSGTDHFTTWVKTDPGATLVRHVVDVQKAVAEFREASARRPDTSSQAQRFDKHLPNRSPVQKRLSIYNWNPGRRRGKEDAFEKQIAGKWHVISLQEASEYVDHDILTHRFHVTPYGGCAILYNNDTFYPNIDVKSIYLHDTRRVLPDQVMEGDQGWVMQGVLSRASFRRPPLSGQKTFTVLSLQISNIYTKKTGYCKKTHPHNPSHHDWSSD